MPPHNDNNVPRQRTSPSASPTEEPGNGGFVWIQGNTLDELRSKKNMTSVRRKAMDSFLKLDKSKQKSRATSEISDKSRSSIGSQGGAGHPSGVDASRKGKKSTTSKQSSPVKSPNTTAPTQEAGGRESSNSRALQSVLPQAPIVIPMRKRNDLIFDITQPPPLVSIGKSLDPFRTMFQTRNPRVSVEELKHHCSRFFGTRGLGKHWIPTCLDHAHTFLSTIYLAAAHSDVIKELPVESLETAALRQDIIHLIGTDLRDPEKKVADPNIIAVSQIIIGEVIRREEASLRYHEDGMENMIAHRGGLHELGMNGHLASAVSWVHLASAILRETSSKPMYHNYCTERSAINYPPSATIPESPLFCPHGRFITVQRSKMCKLETLKLLESIKTMIELFLHEARQSRRNSNTLMNLYRHITTDYPPISQHARHNVLTPADWRYEAIRLTAVIQATAIIRRLPLSETFTLDSSSRKPSTIYTSSAASGSSDSLVSPWDMHNDTPLTDYSLSSSYSHTSYPFPHRNSDASVFSFTSGPSRPSISSTHSGSSSRFIHPTPQPSASTQRLQSLKDALERSDLSGCWGDMAGVILWIGLVMGAASRNCENKPLKNYFSATTMRAGIVLCFEHPQAIHASMLRMTEVVDGLRREGEALVVTRESEGGKRLRR